MARSLRTRTPGSVAGEAVNVITHFDSRYKPFAQALLESLLRFHPDVVLHCLVLDESAAIQHPNVRSYALSDVLGAYGMTVDELRAGRTYRDACWMLEPIWCWYAVHSQWSDSVVYMDADTFLFAPLTEALSGINNHAVGLAPHHFPNPERESHCGRYNFGLSWFHNTAFVEQELRYWCEDTLNAPSGYGGQRLLDSWPSRIGDALYEFPPTLNCGPWQHPEIRGNPPTLNGKRLVHYHFHETRPGPGHIPVTINDRQWNLTNYPLSESTRKSVYEPYLKVLAKHV